MRIIAFCFAAAFAAAFAMPANALLIDNFTDGLSRPLTAGLGANTDFLLTNDEGLSSIVGGNRGTTATHLSGDGNVTVKSLTSRNRPFAIGYESAPNVVGEIMLTYNGAGSGNGLDFTDLGDSDRLKISFSANSQTDVLISLEDTSSEMRARVFALPSDSSGYFIPFTQFGDDRFFNRINSIAFKFTLSSDASLTIRRLETIGIPEPATVVLLAFAIGSIACFGTARVRCN